MANYTYVCFTKNCDEEKDVNHRMNEEPEIKCEKCGKKMNRVIRGSIGIKIRGGTPIHYRRR